MSSTNPRPGPVPRYTPEQVFARALELIDAGPPASFSMRRLADALGISAMTLYGYAASKDAILEGATLLALDAVQVDPGPDAPWEDVVRGAMREIHEVCHRHPNLATLVVGQPAAAPGLYRNRERALAALLDAGFAETAALHALGVFSYYALGFGGGQAALEGRGRAAPDLDPEQFPRLTATGERYAEHASDTAFEHGLNLLIEGFARELGGGPTS